ncbi:hypothetical protein [Sandaracinobacteroides saxicola]|uniref:Uncharacterized protein n=1 Tax=Sandaracinobacteroides saxicola TaxID=2759707 RepID=A0A7G5IGJ9_9SPHN|nr:hypothetical protein [Sandaracinobacteroides saxicola]QMW22491.1 hypothetical protein H3309_14295 [Sandaracinobacteroides saxicola]
MVATRYSQLRSATARLAAAAAEQDLYLQKTLFPDTADKARSEYNCDELALEFNDYYIAVEHMVAAGELSAEQAEALRGLDMVLDLWSGRQNADFWRRGALHSDPRWDAVRESARNALKTMPVRDE